MGTAVLRSEDCLKSRFHFDFGSRSPPAMKTPKRKPPRTGNVTGAGANSPPPPTPKPGRSQPVLSRPARSPPPPSKPGRPSPARACRKPIGKENAGAGDAEIRPQRALVMEEVTILKRGEEPKAFAPSPTVDRRSDGEEVSLLCSTNRLGPDPEILPKKMGFADLCNVYAGPAFFVSPAPSSLPFPAFFLKKGGGDATRSDEATKSLRCLLRLDDVP